MSGYRILHVETDLGLQPSGVRRLGRTLLDLGLAEAIRATSVEHLKAPAFDRRVDPELGARNIPAVAKLAIEQADRLTPLLDAGDFPVVLGGDDSVLFGCLVALRRRGSPGLALIDGHTDFWDPPDGTGELSDSDLWIATGHGPSQLADLEGLRPLAAADACVVYGHRDRALQLRDGSQDVYHQPMLVRNLDELRAASIPCAAKHAIAVLRARDLDGVWLHLDADCLDDELMPAVDWRVPGGLQPDEVVGLARPLRDSGLVRGISVTIYNPALDTPQLAAGRVLFEVVTRILR